MRLRDLYENLDRKKQITFEKLGDGVIQRVISTLRMRLPEAISFLDTSLEGYIVTDVVKDFKSMLSYENVETGRKEFEEKYSKMFFDTFWLLATKSDPTRNGKYLVWITKMFSDPHKFPRMEDFERLSNALKTHHDYLTRRVFQNSNVPDIEKLGDINQFVSLSALEVGLRKIQALNYDQSGFVKKFQRLMGEFQKKSEVEVIYKTDDDMTWVFELRSSEASTALFAQKASWCTAPKGNSFFDIYYRQGPIYCIVLLDKDEFYQIHTETMQFMDKNEMLVDLETFKHYNLLEHVSNLNEYGLSLNAWMYAMFPEPDYVGGGYPASRLTSDDVDNLIEKMPELVLSLMIDKVKLTDEQINNALNNGATIIQLVHEPTPEQIEVAYSNNKSILIKISSQYRDRIPDHLWVDALDDYQSAVPILNTFRFSNIILPDVAMKKMIKEYSTHIVDSCDKIPRKYHKLMLDALNDNYKDIPPASFKSAVRYLEARV